MANIVIDPANVVPGTGTQYLQLNTAFGESASAGEVVCLLAADQKYYRADADTPEKRAVVGILGGTASSAGQRASVISSSPTVEIGAHGQAVGTPLFLSQTPGKLCPLADLTSGALPVLVGYTVSATAIQVVIAAGTQPKP